MRRVYSMKDERLRKHTRREGRLGEKREGRGRSGGEEGGEGGGGRSEREERKGRREKEVWGWYDEMDGWRDSWKSPVSSGTRAREGGQAQCVLCWAGWPDHRGGNGLEGRGCDGEGYETDDEAVL